MNFLRRDSGDLRLIVVVVISIVSCSFLFSGYRLIQSGITGSWQIVSSFKGWTLYFTSISPGLLVIGLGALILILGLPRVLKSL